MASEILQIPEKDITISMDKVHYDRPIGEAGEIFTKMIWGIPSEEIFQQTIDEVEKDNDFMAVVNNMDNESKEMKYSIKQAIYIIENLYRLHEENRLNELTPKWADALKESMSTLRKSIKTQTITDYLEYGEYLLSDTQILKLNNYMSAKFYGLCGIRLEEMVKLYEMLRAAGRVHESEERDQLREAKKHYDRVFPEPGNKWGKYIALKNGLWGILNINGKEEVPCIMDHIYERMCSDGVIILEKDGLFGVFNDSNYVYPEYKPEDIELEVEGMVRVRKNGRWGWLDESGRYTRNKRKACFSNYEDDEK